MSDTTLGVSRMKWVNQVVLHYKQDEHLLDKYKVQVFYFQHKGLPTKETLDKVLFRKKIKNKVMINMNKNEE